MEKGKMTLIACCVLFFMTMPVIGAEKIKLATLDWEPYIGKKMKNQGFIAEMVVEAFKKSGYDVELTYLPWARVVKMAEQGQFDGYLPEYYSDSLKVNFLVSVPFQGGPLGFFKRKGENISYKTLKDLMPYKIGVVRGYINTEEFDSAKYLKKEEATDDLMNLNKLIKKRIDLVVCDKFVGKYLLEKNLAEQSKNIEFLSPSLEEKVLYLCISKKTPNAELKIKAFNDGYKKLKDQGMVESIMKKNGF